MYCTVWASATATLKWSTINVKFSQLTNLCVCVFNHWLILSWLQKLMSLDVHKIILS